MTKTKQDVVMDVMIEHFPGYKHSQHYKGLMRLSNKIVEALELQEQAEKERIPQLPAEPGLQVAFMEEAGAALGHPDHLAANSWLGLPVRVSFNHTTEIRVGRLTSVKGPVAAPYLILDNDEANPINLRSVQSLSSP